MAESDRRGSERLMLGIPIRVLCFAGSAGSFTEDTHTIRVNRAGARIALRNGVSTGDEIRIVNLENMNEADFRVAGPVRLNRGEISEWGVELLDRNRNIWGIDFPAPLEASGSEAAALLRCEGCGKEALLVLTLVEADILEENGSVQKLCEKCGQFSTWGHADIERHAQPSSPATEAPTPALQWDGKAERRVYKRVAVKLSVLVRNHKGQEEASKTEDISKGGLAVALQILLALGEIVTVACPFTKGSENLFQKAEVRRRVTITPDTKWLYGLRYIR
jgi:hypothetical protein